MAKDKNRLKQRLSRFDKNKYRKKQEPEPEQAPPPPPPPSAKATTNKPEKGKEARYEASGVTSNFTPELIQLRIEELNEKDTNLVFTFGDVGSSKTTILSALSYYLKENYLYFENTENKTINKYIYDTHEKLRRGEFPPITSPFKLYEYDIACKRGVNDEWINLTFVEMSGEHYNKVSPGLDGELPETVKIYLQKNDLPISILICVGYPELMEIDGYQNKNITNQDSLIAAFINFLVGNGIKCDDICVVVTKCDEKYDIQEEKIKEKLNRSFNQIKQISQGYNVFTFSVGEVEKEGWSDGTDRILKSDFADCGPILEWIVSAFEEPPKSRWRFW